MNCLIGLIVIFFGRTVVGLTWDGLTPWFSGSECNCNGFSSRCVFDAKLYEQTGHGGYCLDCAGNRDGPNCERCRPNYYMRSDGFCVPCECDEMGSMFQQCNSDGKCQCKTGVTGDKCDRCAQNHFEFSKSGCKNCDCSVAGSTYNEPTCNPENGFCACKENVEGKQCRECKPGFFNLDPYNEFGCTPCFCYGHSSKCHSASGYSKYTLESSFAKGSEKWRAEDEFGKHVPIKYEAISQSIGVQSQEDELVYFVAPDRFLGDQRASYNQLLEFALRIGYGRLAPAAADLIIEGNGKRITNTMFAQDNKYPKIQTQFYKFRLHEHSDFQWQPRLSSRDFISVLTNLTAIKIRGTYSTQGVGFLDDVKLETASIGAAGQPALWMEFCECPPGYVGQFCESCTPGFRHSPAHGGPFTKCIPCDCNSHASICESETGKCICEHHTAGENCELCARGYYGNALAGTPEDCLPCNCPDGGACIQLEEDVVMCTECPTGYSGHRCDVCSDGYFGDPTGRFGPPSSCQICECNQNIDTNAIGNCNTTSGECLRCIHNTGGPRCEICLQGFYGNALVLPKGDCKPCECYPVGTEPDLNGEPICDSSTGACHCKDKVTGRNCDQCEDGYFNLVSGEGCQSCNCDPIGSFNQSCNLYSGQCFCRPGVTGLRCDHCEARKFGFSLEGCKDCDCDLIGSKDLQCDASGQCPCLDNVEGRRCDRCKENKHDRHRGCVDCPECYNLVQDAYRTHNNKLKRLNDILNEIERRPTVIDDADFPVELGKLQDDIDDLYDKVKTATGEDSKVQDIEKRENEVSRTLETVKEIIEGIQKNTDKVERNSESTADYLYTIESNLGEFLPKFELNASRVLADARKRSLEVGQQSEKMTNIAQEARELAENLEDQAAGIAADAQEAKNKSNEVYELAKKANTNQTLIKENANKLRHDVERLEDKLNKTVDFTNTVGNKSREVKNEALNLFNEVHNMYVDKSDVPELTKKSKGLRTETEELEIKADLFLNKSQDLRDMIDEKNEKGVKLLEEANSQQEAFSELVDEIHAANDSIVSTINKWNDRLGEAERIYKDLESSDSDTRKLRQEAQDALKEVPKIQLDIDDTLLKTDDAQRKLSQIAELVEGALQASLDAKEEEEMASKELEHTSRDAQHLSEDTEELLNNNTRLVSGIEDSEKKLQDLLKRPLSNNTLIDQVKANVGKAVQETDKTTDKVAQLLSDVQDIISELENTPDIDEAALDQLERNIKMLEKEYYDTKVEDRLAELESEHNNRKDRIVDYNIQIQQMEQEVDNIRHIVAALPDKCFKRVVLEP